MAWKQFKTIKKKKKEVKWEKILKIYKMFLNNTWLFLE